jgi:hypothetical protein
MAIAVAVALSIVRQQHKRMFGKKPILKSYEKLCAIRLLSPEGTAECKWFKDAVADPDTTELSFLAVAVEGMEMLHTILTLDFAEFTKANGDLYAKYGKWCAANNISTSTEDKERITNFFKSLCALVKPTREDYIPAQTAFNITRRVYWFDRMRMYQGYDEWDPDHMRSRGSVLKAKSFRMFVDDLKKQIKEWQKTRDFTAANSAMIKKRITPGESKAIQDAVLNGDLVGSISKTTADQIHMRTIAMSAISNSTLLRSKDVRSLRDSQMMMHELPDIKPANCTALMWSLNNGKTLNSLMHEENAVGCIEHADPTLSSPIIMAAFKVFQEDLSATRGVSTLTKMDTYFDALKDWINGGAKSGAKPEPTWRKNKTFFIDDPTASISYSTQASDVKRFNKLAGVTGKGAVLHLPRSDKTSGAMESGRISLPTITMAGGWGKQTECEKTYLAGAAVAPVLLTLAKWDNADSFYCCWDANATDIPVELKSTVMSKLDGIIKKLESAKAFSLKNPKIITTNDYFPEHIYLNTMTKLRSKFITTAPLIYSALKELPVYRDHPLFQHELYPIYAAQEITRIKVLLSTFNINEQHDKRKFLLPLLPSENKNKRKRPTDEMIAEAAEFITSTASTAMPMPNVLEPDNIYEAYKQYTTVFKESPRNWTEWYGKDKSNMMRFHKSYDTYLYIDAHSNSNANAASVCSKLQTAGTSLGVSNRDFVKNCVYFYFHPPKSTTQAPKRPPKCTPEQLESAITAAGLPALK